jgi:hypothetical protein
MPAMPFVSWGVFMRVSFVDLYVRELVCSVVVSKKNCYHFVSAFLSSSCVVTVWVLRAEDSSLL